MTGWWNIMSSDLLTASNEDSAQCDVLVCGGGPAGCAAALFAARVGAKTLLVERYGRLGGLATQGLVGPLMGGAQSPVMEEIVAHLGGNQVDPETCDVRYAEILLREGVEVRLHTWAFAALMSGSAVAGVRTLSKEGMGEIRAQIVVDATGDGDIACASGAAYEVGRPGDGLLQPMSIQYRIAGVDKTRGLLCGSEEQARVVRVPEGTWEEVVERGQAAGELDSTIGVIRLYESDHDRRVVNATQINGVDGTRVADLTRAELEGRRQAVQVVEFLRRHAPGYEEAYIAEMPAIVGVRETRRFAGMETLTREDLIAGRKWDTAVVRDAKFCIDIHNPTGGGQAEGTAARVQPYDIPYGCLVPREVDNLLLAGRCISGTHEAHASYRVQRICMAIGAAAGAAAALCVRDSITPRALQPALVQQALGI
jgi:hypothetical protein